MSPVHEPHSRECPLANVDQRLEDVHQHWHQAETVYFYPDRFRVAIQTTIQTLRTVTFILQNRKQDIPDFDAWYGNWQEKLRADSLMRWMVDARNKIEKRGDLEMHSFVRAEIVASYLDEGPSVEVPAHLFDAPLLLVRKIPPGDLRDHIANHGALRIQRRWIENSLPEYELLDAVAIAYGYVSQIVHDAHKKMGLDAPATTNVETGQHYGEGSRAGRLPCMIGHADERAIHINLADGRPIGFEEKEIKLKKSDEKKIVKRYGNAHKGMLGLKNATEDQILSSLFRTARKVFLRDRYHQSIFFLFKQRKLVCQFATRPEDQAQKYLLMRRLAHKVTIHGADSVIMLGEAWMAPVDPTKPYQRAGESPARQEVLIATLVTKDNDPVHLTAKIRRGSQKLALERTSVCNDLPVFSFAPIYEAWGRPIPEQWIKGSRKPPKESEVNEP